MSDVVIRLNNVGKSYVLCDRPQDRLKQILLRRLGRRYGRDFWALRDVSFDVQRGESIGVVGRNGSGKSTLLQIIAGILQPSTGQVEVRGRVAALLELGSGFSPEFTGRENVFLNGAVLGLAHDALQRCFDDIAAFADIGEFIDQPLKVYSSGMIVRLAFAVQAVVQKDVLIVDEALAVGDEAFQRKCYARLEDFRRDGGTVLLVTHNTQAIVHQCERCLFMHQGRMLLDGPSKPVTDLYQCFMLGTPGQQHDMLLMLRTHAAQPADWLLRLIRSKLNRARDTSSTTQKIDPALPQPSELSYGNGSAEIFDYGMYDEMERPANVLIAGHSYTWRYFVRFHQPARNVNFGMMLKTVSGLDVVAVNNQALGKPCHEVMQDDVFEVCFRLRMNLAPGVYFLNSGVMGGAANGHDQPQYLHRRVDVCAIKVVAPDQRAIHGLAYVEPQIEMRPV